VLLDEWRSAREALGLILRPTSEQPMMACSGDIPQEIESPRLGQQLSALIRPEPDEPSDIRRAP
jgi:hypothetical protein